MAVTVQLGRMMNPERPIPAEVGIPAQEPRLVEGRGVVRIVGLRKRLAEPGEQMVEELALAAERLARAFREFLQSALVRIRRVVPVGVSPIRDFRRGQGQFGIIEALEQRGDSRHIVDRLAEIGRDLLTAGQECSGLAELGEEVGQELFENEQIALELLDLGAALR